MSLVTVVPPQKRLQSLADDAVAEGATLLTGGAEGLEEYQEIRYFTLKRRETL
jgi:hypothetical protein